MGFKRLEPQDIVISSETVSSTVWTDKDPTLRTFYTSSTQREGSTGPFYLNIYQAEPAESNSEIQFSIAYADRTGGGTTNYDSSVPGYSPSSTNYGQYRTLLLEDENSDFIFGDNFVGDYFYVLNIERSRYKEKLLPSSFNLILSSSNNQLSELHLTDNSGMVSLPTYFGTQRAYQIISGSDGRSYDGGSGYTANSGSYGLFFPDTSIIVLNGAALDDVQVDGINLETNRTTNSNQNNATKLFTAISGSGEFKLNSEETITSNYVYVRARNAEFNYSENPSFISGSTGEVIYDYFIDNPQVFPTTIGLYNDSNELLAVAKLSRPIQKNFVQEALVTVKLDF